MHNISGLPLIPGNTYTDPSIQNFHVAQTLSWKNGYRIPDPYQTNGLGGLRRAPPALTQEELDELANFTPSLTYGRSKQEPPKNFVPSHVAFDKKVLRFYGYFKETVNESPAEYYRVRRIILFYYLEDDSISIDEPKQENSGMPQGTLIKRQQLPKNEIGDKFTWRDINRGQNLCVYGRLYRICSCDPFTKKYLESEGIIVNDEEGIPNDPYLSKRAVQVEMKTAKTPSAYDIRRQFIEKDKKVLRFYSIWDDRDQLYGELRKFVIHYYLVDDTMEVREVHEANCGRDPFPLLIRRDKVPRNRYDISPTFPLITMELSDNEIKGYISPRDLKIGHTIVILNRRFLMYGCDDFTKAYYYKMFGVTDFTFTPPADMDKEILIKTGLLSISDVDDGNTKSCDIATEQIVPDEEDEGFVNPFELDSRTLRYGACLDSLRPEDKGREFILSYQLNSGLINIFEPPVRNSGIPGGMILSRTKVPKPNVVTASGKPVFYGPKDFMIGATIDAFGNRFVINNADLFVLKFLEANTDVFDSDLIDSVRQRLKDPDVRKRQEKLRSGVINLKREPGDTVRLMSEIKSQLKKLYITDRSRIDYMFLKYNNDRNGSITVANVQDMCRKMNLPDDVDIVSGLLNESGTNNEMSLEEFREFFES